MDFAIPRQPRPDVPRVRTIPLEVDDLGDRGVRFRIPGVRGWSVVARNLAQIGHALVHATNEYEAHAYARARSETYDHSAMTDVDPEDPLTAPEPRQHNVKGSRVSDRWSIEDDGYWRSPGGRRYRPDSQMVERVRKAFAGHGRPLVPGADDHPDGAQEAGNEPVALDDTPGTTT